MIVGAHTLLANGGVMAPVGTAVVAMAAKKHAVPFVVLVGMHKLSPLFPHDPDVNFNEFKSPAGIVNYDVIAEPLQNNLRSPEAEDGTVGTDESCVPSACPIAMNTSPPLHPLLHIRAPSIFLLALIPRK